MGTFWNFLTEKFEEIGASRLVGPKRRIAVIEQEEIADFSLFKLRRYVFVPKLII